MTKMIIDGTEILPGEQKQVNINIAKLPSRTTIDIPIIINRSKNEGPTLLLLAGLHGDEINGVEIVRRMITSGKHIPDAGTTICIPIINIYGFLNFSRELPDGKDINRSFPGSTTGSLASRVAHFMVQEILPIIDFGVDFHTGGGSRTNFPQVRCVLDDPINLELAKAFNPPIILNAPFRPNSLRKEAYKNNKRIIVYEGGESLRFDEYAIQEAIDGTRRLMYHLGMLNSTRSLANKQETKVVLKSSWLRASYSGLFRSAFQAGDYVKKNQIIGTITDPFGEFEVKRRAPFSGIIIGKNNIPVVNAGDALIHLGAY
jgi:uncharacterized protein